MKDFVQSGQMAQVLLIVLVWGTIAVLLVTRQTPPDPVFDAGFVIVGYYFHAQVEAVTTHRLKGVKEEAEKNPPGRV